MQINSFNNCKKNTLYHQNFTAAKLVTPKFSIVDGLKILDPILAKGNSKDSFIRVITESKKQQIPSLWITYLTQSDYAKNIGRHEFLIADKVSCVHGLNISVNPSEERQGYGELLRLINIIHMKENNLRLNVITSVTSAIPFHTKYHFVPTEIQHIQEENNIYGAIALLTKLMSRSANSEEKIAEGYKTRILRLLNTIKNTNKLPKNYISEMTDIVSEFFKSNRTTSIKDPEFSSLRVLNQKLDNIEAHSDYFNELFKKHGLDYKL